MSNSRDDNVEVVFQLSSEQLQRFKVQEKKALWEIGSVSDYVLTYSGSRSHLQFLLRNDWREIFLIERFGFPTPKRYSASQPRLCWHESYDDYLEKRAPWTEYLIHTPKSSIPDRFVSQSRVMREIANGGCISDPEDISTAREVAELLARRGDVPSQSVP